MTNSIRPITYKRKVFNVTAVAVTPENIEDVALWCSGIIMKDPTNDPRTYVKVPTAKSVPDALTKAFPGDFVVRTDRGTFRVFRANAFGKTFEEIELQHDNSLKTLAPLNIDEEELELQR